MEKTLIEKLPEGFSLALSNLSKKIYRTVSLIFLAAISSAVLFASLILSSSLKSGITGLRSRLGADLLVVPEGYEQGAENVLLTGEPNYFYMDKSVLESIRGLEGIENATAQFYLTSLAESCCDFPIQIIGFDRKSDFIVQNWARTKLGENSSTEDFLLSGSNVSLTHGKVKFFGEEHTISGRLSKSGTGMDNTIFCDLESLQKIFESAKSKGFGFISDGDTKNKISTVLIKVSDGSSTDSVALRIKNAVKGIQVLTGEKFLKSFSERISSFLVFFYSISALVLLISIFSLGIVFSLTINERQREFSILRVLGANRRQLRQILLAEAAFLGGSGAVTGIALSALIVIPFNAIIAEKISLPFAMSSAGEILIFALLTFALCTASSVFAALNGAFRISKIEPYGGIK
ncbi:FtsX-like permease family protein [uncultured Treponema sp.]|uniref:ABC transporter permease n=1 Tax=uncultured Treponema sp. TaxID=162155 RepID=UPI0025F39F5B|nr:FtsX-like permease family protein [uncultured Treponema sp.]